MSPPELRNLSVDEARARMLDGLAALSAESLALDARALGRVLAEDIAALRDQPPYDASAMDGWAVAEGAGAFRIVGESAAGRPFGGTLGAGEAVRIFTGAAVPVGAVRVVPQEVAKRAGDGVEVDGADPAGSSFIRPAGGDFRRGELLLPRGAWLDAWRLALAAAAGRAEARVFGRPRVAIFSTGEEIVRAGAAAGPHQIFDSAGPALCALTECWGGRARIAPPVGDSEEAIVDAVQAVEAELLVTVGGASVGDHDLVKPALARLGLELRVETVRVRPGKPTWFGRVADGRRVLGLPGNPAAALVCAELFLKPLLLAWQGAVAEPALSWAALEAPLPPEGPREHWMRAKLGGGADGCLTVRAFAEQDSSLVTVFAQADALLRRPAGAPAASAREPVQVLRLERL